MWLWLRIGSWCVATALVVLADDLIAAIEDAQIDVVVDGEVEVTAFPLHATTIVVGDEVEVQSCVGLAKVEVGILQSVDGLCACGCHAWPTAEGFGIAPGIECQFGLARLVEDEEGIAIVLHGGLKTNLLHAVSSDEQVDVAFDGEVEVGQLRTVATVVEDEVLVEAGVGSTHVEVLPYDAALLPGACRVHARPVTVEVVDVAPHVECQGIPARLVIHIDYEAVVLGLWLFATTPVVALPTLSPDISKCADTWIVEMGGKFARSGIFHTLCGGIESIAVGKCLAAYESARIEIDAKLHIAFGSLGQKELRLSDGCAIAVECTHNVDLLINCGAERRNELEQDTVGLRRELLTLMREHDLLIVGTTAHHSGESQQRQYQTI